MNQAASFIHGMASIYDVTQSDDNAIIAGSQIDKPYPHIEKPDRVVSIARQLKAPRQQPKVLLAEISFECTLHRFYPGLLKDQCTKIAESRIR